MNKTLVIIALASTVSYSAYRMLRSEPTPADSEQLVLDRVWIDHMPRSDKDTIQVFLALTEQPVGVFQASSAWRGAFEMFRHETSGTEIRIVYPQTNERETVTATARRCSEQQMDYCLELEGGSRGVKRYYSREGWEIDGTANVAAARARIEALITAPH